MTPRDLYINLPALLATEREHSHPNSLRIAGMEKIYMHSQTWIQVPRLPVSVKQVACM